MHFYLEGKGGAWVGLESVTALQERRKYGNFF